MSTQHTFHLAPRDLLFLRDARPMAAADAGLGANWPRPDQLWNALINAFHRQWPEIQPWEHAHRKRSDENPLSSDRFGALKTTGPFPVRVGQGEPELFLPCPLDLSADDDGTLHPMTLVPMPKGSSDLPGPLTHTFASSRLGKQELPAWLSAAEFVTYVGGRPVAPAKVELYDTERSIGIAVDPDTHAAAEHRLYQAEYLRLREGVRLAFAAACEIVGAERRTVDVLAQGPFGAPAFDFVMGGQQGLVKALRAAQPLALPPSRLDGSGGPLLKWVLFTPAVFPAIAADAGKGIGAHPGGWLPTWVHPDTGQVMLPRGPLPPRDRALSRDAWRQAVAKLPRFGARLVAARIGKPLGFSGWDLQTGPKPTVLAVPAGSAYVFQCTDRQEFADLAAALAWNGGQGTEVRNRRSAVFGEKGFGLGVCSPGNANDDHTQATRR